MSKRYFVYILASRRNGTLYVGVTNDLVRRLMQHRKNRSDVLHAAAFLPMRCETVWMSSMTSSMSFRN